jgi:hypothetical protein
MLTTDQLIELEIIVRNQLARLQADPTLELPGCVQVYRCPSVYGNRHQGKQIES